jgi:hypothetical protein
VSLTREQILERLRGVRDYVLGMEEHYDKKKDEPRWSSYYYARQPLEALLEASDADADAPSPTTETAP